MFKIEIRTLGGAVEHGWLLSDTRFWFRNTKGSSIGWTFGEGDTIKIVEEVDWEKAPMCVRHLER